MLVFLQAHSPEAPVKASQNPETGPFPELHSSLVYHVPIRDGNIVFVLVELLPLIPGSHLPQPGKCPSIFLYQTESSLSPLDLMHTELKGNQQIYTIPPSFVPCFFPTFPSLLPHVYPFSWFEVSPILVHLYRFLLQNRCSMDIIISVF